MSLLDTEFSRFCLIQGKEALREFLLENGATAIELELLYEPMIWEQVWKKEAGVISERFDHQYQEESGKARIKLGFLLSLWNNYVLDNKADRIAGIVRKLLGESPIHYSVFDKWWNLSRPMHENSRELETLLSPETIAAFDETGFPETDEWLENLKPKP